MQLEKHTAARRGHRRERDAYEVARRRMLTEQLIPKGIADRAVLEAMGTVKRHLFVAKGMEEQAYLDRALSIGEGQTISQPLMVAMMTQVLAPASTDRVLEIGTGSGYQTAVVALLVKQVYTVERIAALSIRARKLLYKLHYKNITFRIGDGTLGWPEEGPYDGILVTAGAPVVPAALQEQLSTGGRLVIPIGDEETQELTVIERTKAGFERRALTSCRFVKLIGEQGWK